MSTTVFFNLTPWSRFLLEKPTVSQLVKKFAAFCGSRKFITAFISARHLSLSCESAIQPRPPSRFLKIHFNIILLSTQTLPSALSLPLFFSPNPFVHLSSPPVRATCFTHLIIPDLISRIPFGEHYIL